jgi:hypothetical protein
VEKYAVIVGAYFSVIVINSLNKEKKQWGWKII